MAFVPSNYKNLQSGVGSTPLLRALHGELRQVFGTRAMKGMMSGPGGKTNIHQILQSDLSRAPQPPSSFV